MVQIVGRCHRCPPVGGRSPSCPHVGRRIQGWVQRGLPHREWSHYLQQALATRDLMITMCWHVRVCRTREAREASLNSVDPRRAHRLSSSSPLPGANPNWTSMHIGTGKGGGVHVDDRCAGAAVLAYVRADPTKRPRHPPRGAFPNPRQSLRDIPPPSASDRTSTFAERRAKTRARARARNQALARAKKKKKQFKKPPSNATALFYYARSKCGLQCTIPIVFCSEGF